MLRLLSRFIFWIQGWKADDEFIKNNRLDKFILVGAPHTSNWDAIIFIAATYHLKIDVKFLIKQDWIKFPFNLFFKPLGAIGIDRSQSNSMVDVMVELFNSNEKLIITISPEGTRSPNANWKKGFYFTALQANVPILLGYLDYEKRVAGIKSMVVPSGNANKDLIEIGEFYKQFNGKIPENYEPYKPVE